MRLSTRDAWVFLIAIAAVLRVLLAVESPTPYGYVFDFYHEGVQRMARARTYSDRVRLLAVLSPASLLRRSDCRSTRSASD